MIIKRTEQAQQHVHNWYPKGFDEEYCKNPYNGKPCNAIKVSNEELQRRMDEWNAYYKLCQETRAKKDYEEMRIAFKGWREDHDPVAREKMLEIRARINKRMIRVSLPQDMEPQYQFNEDQYETKGPTFPDPMNPHAHYIN